MKMGGILQRGASETRSWRFGAVSPFRKLILVRPRTEDCRPSPGGEHAGETGGSLAPLAGCPREEHEACRCCIGGVVAWTSLGHPAEDGRGLRTAERPRRP